jgi:diaminohydroxyphosphoribosylaminopyrimidine deaminase/5-amino-6-(5-phosphoribosylamino)uracil reductase
MTTSADIHLPYLRRCFDLARRATGAVSPNPLVGAVLVYGDRIIGEGWHARYGQAHAEVHAVASVSAADRHLIPAARLYCNLEPCFHYGKTPPCVDLVLRENIRQVIISNTDPNPKVAGQSVQKMRAAGVEVVTGILENEGARLNRAFFTWISKKRPYIILKWAQSADGYLGRTGAQTPISSPHTQRLTHRWRTEADAILVGAHTALTDNPRLDNRLYPGPAPLRIALDRHSLLPAGRHLLDDTRPTWIAGPPRPGRFSQTLFFDLSAQNPLESLLDRLAQANQAILYVEGGPATHQLFMDRGLFDELRIITNTHLYLGDGLPAAKINACPPLRESKQIGADRIELFYPDPMLT